MAEELEAESKALEDEIKAEMEALDTAEITADIFKIRWTRVISNRLDTQSVNNRFTRLLSVFMWASIPQKNPGTVPEKGLINKKVPHREPATSASAKRDSNPRPSPWQGEKIPIMCSHFIKLSAIYAPFMRSYDFKFSSVLQADS